MDTATEVSTQAPFRIKCAEIWGGILAIDTEMITAGLSASIFSTAHDGDRGGDMYYASVCKWDYLTRLAIADLRGHGGQASRLSAWVYDSMQKRMNTTSGHKILSDLNAEVKSRGFEAITTAVVVGYHATKRKLYFSYAGHPPAYVQRAGARLASPGAGSQHRPHQSAPRNSSQSEVRHGGYPHGAGRPDLPLY